MFLFRTSVMRNSDALLSFSGTNRLQCILNVPVQDLYFRTDLVTCFAKPTPQDTHNRVQLTCVSVPVWCSQKTSHSVCVQGVKIIRSRTSLPFAEGDVVPFAEDTRFGDCTLLPPGFLSLPSALPFAACRLSPEMHDVREQNTTDRTSLVLVDCLDK